MGFIVEKVQDIDEYRIIEDNIAHNDLNDYDTAFSKGYAMAAEGKEEKDVIAIMTHDNPEYDRGLSEGFAQYHLDQYRGETEETSIMMHDSLKKALYAYSLDKSESNFKAVLDAYHKLKDDDSEDHLTVTEEGDELRLAYKYSKEELAKAKELLEKNKTLKIKGYDKESGDVYIEDVEDSVQKLSDSYYGVFSKGKLRTIIRK